MVYILVSHSESIGCDILSTFKHHSSVPLGSKFRNSSFKAFERQNLSRAFKLHVGWPKIWVPSSVLWWESKLWNKICKLFQRQYLLRVTTFCDWSAFDFECFDNSLTFKCHLWPGTKLSMLHVGGERFALLRFTLQWWTICLGIFCEAVVSFLLLLSQTSTSFVHLSSFLITTREFHFFDKHCAMKKTRMYEQHHSPLY